jgi:hypothetical protein
MESQIPTWGNATPLCAVRQKPRAEQALMDTNTPGFPRTKTTLQYDPRHPIRCTLIITVSSSRPLYFFIQSITSRGRNCKFHNNGSHLFLLTYTSKEAAHCLYDP